MLLHVPASPRNPPPRGTTAALAQFRCVCIYGAGTEAPMQIMSRWHGNTRTPSAIHLDNLQGERKCWGKRIPHQSSQQQERKNTQGPVNRGCVGLLMGQSSSCVGQGQNTGILRGPGDKLRWDSKWTTTKRHPFFGFYYRSHPLCPPFILQRSCWGSN